MVESLLLPTAPACCRLPLPLAFPLHRFLVIIPPLLGRPQNFQSRCNSGNPIDHDPSCRER
jgi:hypothetical protein